MKYQCLNESCGKLFQHAARLTNYGFNFNDAANIKQPVPYMHPADFVTTAHLETYVCPYCGSRDIEEYTPEPLPQTVEEIGNVYIYDLTSGAQTGLDKLLAEGYKIVNRYSKQYHLERPKAKTFVKCEDNCTPETRLTCDQHCVETLEAKA